MDGFLERIFWKFERLCEDFEGIRRDHGNVDGIGDGSVVRAYLVHSEHDGGEFGGVVCAQYDDFSL